jgi:signal transduction histidine kinase
LPQLSKISARMIASPPPRRLVLTAAALLTGVVGWIDYATGSELTFFPFYALPILMVVLSAGREAGHRAAVLTVLVWCLALYGGHPYQTYWGIVFAMASRYCFFALVVVASASVIEQRFSDRERIAMLERTRELETEVSRAGEKEQQRIGRELHDGLCQNLAGIAALSTTLARKLNTGDDPKLSAEAAEIAHLLHEAISEARDLARGLSLSGGIQDRLADALRGLALNVEKRFRVECEVEIAEGLPRLLPEVKMHLLRIAQEAVRNAIVHGETPRVEIRMERRGRGATLSIRDFGVGLPEDAPENVGMGRRTMRERARLLGGVLEMRRNEPQGTIVACHFPLAGNAVGIEGVVHESS